MPLETTGIGTANQTSSTSVYNPQANSPIPAPKPNFCVTCGQPIAPIVKPLTNEMNVYVNTISGNKVVLNDNRDEIKIQDAPLVRQGSKAYEAYLAKLNAPKAPPAPPK